MANAAFLFLFFASSVDIIYFFDYGERLKIGSPSVFKE
jgi:hypothetical protein